MSGDDKHRCEHCGAIGQPGEGCVMGCDAPTMFEARERVRRCPECLWLIGHLPTCSLKPKTEREQGWNEAIEAAAVVADLHGFWGHETPRGAIAARIRELKK